MQLVMPVDADLEAISGQGVLVCDEAAAVRDGCGQRRRGRAKTKRRRGVSRGGVPYSDEPGLSLLARLLSLGLFRRGFDGGLFLGSHVGNLPRQWTRKLLPRFAKLSIEMLFYIPPIVSPEM
jgi:hypothetical protein